MNIVEFKGSFTELARPTLFKVTGLGVGRQMEFLCKASQIPASTIGVIEVPYRGRKIKIRGDRTYAEWTIEVITDESWNLRNDFEEWHQLMNDPILNIGIPVAEGYKRDAYVEQLSTTGATIAKYNLVGCFPQDIQPVELSADNTDQVGQFSVTIAYDFWVRV